MSTKHMASPATLASVQINTSSDFRAASYNRSRVKKSDKRTTVPFSVRFTPDERAWLEDQAGNQHLSTFIRNKLLKEQAEQRRASRKPKVDDKNLAIVMALFGDQRIASNLNQLAKHANMGTLDVSNEVIEQIQEAYAAMVAVRNYLLDIKPQSIEQQ